MDEHDSHNVSGQSTDPTTSDLGSLRGPTADTPEDRDAHGGTRPQTPIGVPELARPGDALRTLPAEARQRGTRLVSAAAMQARLFSVYDAATAAEDALALVQEQLTLTLNRSYYDADEIESTAARLDALLTEEATELADDRSATTD